MVLYKSIRLYSNSKSATVKCSAQKQDRTVKFAYLAVYVIKVVPQTYVQLL